MSTAKTTTSRRKTKSSGACAATPTMITRACGSRVTSATSGPTRVASDTQRRMRPATAKKRKPRFKSQSKLEPLSTPPRRVPRVPTQLCTTWRTRVNTG